MRRFSTRILSTGILFLASTGLSIASVCHTTAPGYSDDDVTYFDLYTGEQKNSQGMRIRHLDEDREMAKGVERFSKLLSGRWTGTVTETICKGEQRKLRVVTTHEDVEAEIDRRFSGVLSLDAEKSTRRRVKFERVQLTPDKRLRRVNLKGGLVVSRVELNSDTGFSFEEKSRVDGLTGARLVHQIRDVELVGDKLRIQRDIYINGFFAAHEEWLLERT